MTYRDLIIAAIHNAAVDLVREHRDGGIIGVDCAKDGAILRLASGTVYVIRLDEGSDPPKAAA